MTYKEAVIISAYTGFLMCDFDDVHKYIEEKLGRSVWSHELVTGKIQNEIRQKCKPEFLKLCEEANVNR